MRERTVHCENSGQIFTFSDDWNTEDGKVKKLRYKLASGRSVLPHIHPGSSQYFKVLSGKLTIRNGFKKIILNAGEEAKTSVGGLHSQRNDTTNEVEVEEGYEPPIDIEPFFTILPHAQRDKNLLKTMVFFSDFSKVVSSKSILAQVIIKLLGSIGKRLGYKGWYMGHIATLKSQKITINNKQ